MRVIAFAIMVFVFLSPSLKGQFKDVSYYYAADSGAVKKTDHRLSPGKVALLSAVLPGSGQIYNGQWYKAGVFYAGLAVIAYYINWNEKYYVDFKQAYQFRTDNNPYTIDKYDTASHSGQPFISDPQTLIDNREYYHRNRDLLYITGVIVYAAGIIDAYVYAHLRDFSINDNLSVEINMMNFSVLPGGLTYTPSVRLKF